MFPTVVAPLQGTRFHGRDSRHPVRDPFNFMNMAIVDRLISKHSPDKPLEADIPRRFTQIRRTR